MVVQIAPSGIQQSRAACVVCGEAVHFGKVSIGAQKLGGQQAFACARHLAEQSKRSQWIVSWVDTVAGRAAFAVKAETGA